MCVCVCSFSYAEERVEVGGGLTVSKRGVRKCFAVIFFSCLCQETQPKSGENLNSDIQGHNFG